MAPSIDKEIGEIRVALRNAHESIYKLAMQMNNATNIVGDKLTKVDIEVRNVAREVSHIRDNTNTVTSLVSSHFVCYRSNFSILQFPQHATYLGSLLALDAIIWVLAIFLFYKIIVNLRGAGKTSEKWQTKYATMRSNKSRQAIIVAEDPTTESVVIRIPQTRPVLEPPPYRPSLGRNHYRKHTTSPPKYYEPDEASSLLNEIPVERRREWTQIVDER